VHIFLENNESMMAASNRAFSIVGNGSLPFTSVSPDLEKSFRVEISLLSARLRTRSSVVAATYSSNAHVFPSALDAGYITAESSAAAASSPSCKCPVPLTSKMVGASASGATGIVGTVAATSSPAAKHEKKTSGTTIYALPELSLKKCTFESLVSEKNAAAAITTSSDPTVEHEVEWAEGTCTATFERTFKRLPDSMNWHKDAIFISVFQAKATRDKKINKDHDIKEALGYCPVKCDRLFVYGAA
jgi:hypothetical protein